MRNDNDIPEPRPPAHGSASTRALAFMEQALDELDQAALPADVAAKLLTAIDSLKDAIRDQR